MYITQFRNIGNSVGLTLDRATRSDARIQSGDSVVITKTGKGQIALRVIMNSEIDTLEVAQEQKSKWRKTLQELGDD